MINVFTLKVDSNSDHLFRTIRLDEFGHLFSMMIKIDKEKAIYLINCLFKKDFIYLRST